MLGKISHYNASLVSHWDKETVRQVAITQMEEAT